MPEAFNIEMGTTPLQADPSKGLDNNGNNHLQQSIDEPPLHGAEKDEHFLKKGATENSSALLEIVSSIL